ADNLPACQRNVLATTLDLTGFTFLDRPRHDSPVVSAFRFQPSHVGFEWRADYDRLRNGFVNSGLTLDYRISKYFVSASHYDVKSDPVLGPSSNQFRGQINWGDAQKRGWNAGFVAFYDYRQGFLQFSQTQITYNTDCCGFSVQFRRFALGSRNENQF